MSQQVIVVAKRTTWEQYQSDPEGFGEMGPDASHRAKSSHERHRASLDKVMDVLQRLKVRPWLVEGAETAFDVGTATLVITVGGDGTMLSASHHVPHEVPMLGINSDPVFSVGHFCHLVADEALLQNMELALNSDTRPLTRVTRMRVLINSRIVADKILNEALFSHACPAAMTRFQLTTGGLDLPDPQALTRYASSGVWIGTGAGSSGAIASAGGRAIEFESRSLQAVIREPWNPPKFGNEAYIRPFFTLVSKTTDATLYLDGPFLRVPVLFDQVVNFEVSDDHLSLVM